MARVCIADLAPDMILDSDLVAADGRVLARGGITLTTRHLEILHKWGRKWGIEEVNVRLAPMVVATEPEVTVEAAAAVDARVGALFRLANDDHPAVKELMTLARNRMLREASAGTRGSP